MAGITWPPPSYLPVPSSSSPHHQSTRVKQHLWQIDQTPVRLLAGILPGQWCVYFCQEACHVRLSYFCDASSHNSSGVHNSYYSRDIPGLSFSFFIYQFEYLCNEKLHFLFLFSTFPRRQLIAVLVQTERLRATSALWAQPQARVGTRPVLIAVISSQ